MTTASAYPASAQQAKRDTPGKEVTGLTDSRTAQADVATCVFSVLNKVCSLDEALNDAAANVRLTARNIAATLRLLPR